MNLSPDQIRLMVLNVGLAVHNGDWNWKDVISPFTRLYYVTKGSAQIEFQYGFVQLEPNNLYLVPSFTRHSYICNGPFEHYYLHIYENHQDGHSLLEEYTFPSMIKATQLDLLLIERLCEMNPAMKLAASNPKSYDNDSVLMQNIQKNNQRDFSNIMESRGIVLQLMSRFTKNAVLKSNSTDNRINRVLTYIRKNINTNIRIETLAEEVFLSKDHLIRLFNKELGTTPLHYIMNKKVEKAQLMLLTTDISIKSIGLEIGYEDQTYFNRIFKKITGVTPQQYREQNRKKKQ